MMTLLRGPGLSFDFHRAHDELVGQLSQFFFAFQCPSSGLRGDDMRRPDLGNRRNVLTLATPVRIIESRIKIGPGLVKTASLLQGPCPSPIKAVATQDQLSVVMRRRGVASARRTGHPNERTHGRTPRYCA
jgi:hypothetical protein